MAKYSEEMVTTLIKKVSPDREVLWTILVDEVWYIFAPSIDPEEGAMNPYFTVDEATGTLSEFYVVKNLSKFHDVIDKVQSQL